MKKKIILSLVALVAVCGGVAAFSTFESYIINVTAQIVSSILVSDDELAFGTVIPQEFLRRNFSISLSQTFLNTPRLVDVEYDIVQKPKPKWPEPQVCDQHFAEIEEARTYCMANPEDSQCCYPDLCTFLSKEDGDPEDQNDTEAPSYFQEDHCITPGEASGILDKNLGDISDDWIIDLKVPPIKGFVGQDWPESCQDYTVLTDGAIYGCDLWIEVTNVSTVPVCGDGNLDLGEECDDGNTRDGDGCSAECTIELPVCGNGLKEAGEECDEGANNGQECTPPYEDSCNYCSLSCQIVTLSGRYCGDGLLDQGYEECDDGNTRDGDGCSAECQLEGICVAKPDVMQVFDRSGSIDATELATLKTAANAFVTALSPAINGPYMGQTSFSTNGTLDLHLTYFVTAIRAKINGLKSTGWTNLYEGIDLAKNELTNPSYDRNDTDSPDYMVIITDGSANRPEPETTAQQMAKDAATAAKAAGITIYVVGVGTDATTTEYLKNNIATSPVHYFDAADWNELEALLQGLVCPTP